MKKPWPTLLVALVALFAAIILASCRGESPQESPQAKAAPTIASAGTTLTNGTVGVRIAPSADDATLLFHDPRNPNGFRVFDLHRLVPEGLTQAVAFPAEGRIVAEPRQNSTGKFHIRIHRTKSLVYALLPNDQTWALGGDFAVVKKQVDDSWAYEPRIILDGPPEDQEAIAGLEAKVRTAYAGGGSYGPFSATNTRFTGHIFWDLDVWVFPALVFLEPDQAREIAALRLGMLPGFVANARHPEIVAKLSATPSPKAARVAWEAREDGREASTAPTRFAEHQNGAAVLALRQASALGLADPDKVIEFSAAVGEYLRLRSVAEKGKREILDVVSPSEWHVVNNDLATNVALAEVLNLKADQVVFPRDETTYLTFPGDALGQYQQHAALLALFPYQTEAIEAEASQMLQRFRGKTSRNGPAMSQSLEALIGARLGDAETSLEVWRESWRSHSDDPSQRFIEKPGRTDSYFYTGAAGCLNTIIYGFLGLRLDLVPRPTNAPFQRRLKSGAMISARPNLPKSWTRLRVTLSIEGEDWLFDATGTKLTVSKSQ